MHDELKLIDSWLIANIDEFDPNRWETREELDLRRKAFTELCVYLYVREFVHGQNPDHGLKEAVQGHLRNPRFEHIVFRHIDRLGLILSAVLYAIRSGADRGTFADWALSPAALGDFFRYERWPYHQLEFWQFFRALNHPNNPIRFGEIAAWSSLRYPPDPVFGRLEDAYPFTHCVMFGTGIGSWPLPVSECKEPINQTDLIEVAQILSLKFLADQNFDIYGELCLVQALLGAVHRPVANVALDAIRKQLRTDGVVFVPQEKVRGAPLYIREPSRDWARHYHTMLVVALQLLALQAIDFGSKAEDWVADATTAQHCYVFGKGVLELSNYDFISGLTLLASLCGTEFERQNISLFRRIAVTLSRQRRRDGGFGYFPDEHTFLDKKGDGQQKAAFNHALSELNTIAESYIARYTQRTARHARHG